MKSFKYFILIIFFIFIILNPIRALAFDHAHSIWDLLLSRHVKWISAGTGSQVDYAGFKKDHLELKQYLSELSSVGMEKFNSFSRDQRLSFLINSYNAFTVELILTKYPDVESIKDLGSFLKSPWKKKFFTLLGQKSNPDRIEHDMIRKPDTYNESRIHFALVCAAVGCPGLRDEAFSPKTINDQLEDSLRRFLTDKSRNRFNSKSGNLEVSKIFKWYKGDFIIGKYSSLKTFFAVYADLLADTDREKLKLKNMTADIEFLDYDWKLNDVK